MLDFFGGDRTRRGKLSVRPLLERLEARDVPAPLPPTGLVAAGASAGSVSLTWHAPPDPSVTGYDVYEKVWIPGSHGGKGSPGPGHYVYNLAAANLTTTSDTVSGLAGGSYHTYVVASESAAGPSVYSLPATGETWVAPAFTNGPNTVLLSSGAVWDMPVAATDGLTTQVSLLVSGNPLTFSLVSGPTGASINSRTGVVTYTPAAGVTGAVAATFKASNALGSLTQTVAFDVSAPASSQPKPTLSLYATASTYNGQYQQVTPRAVGADGVTAVAGTFAVAYNGGKSGYPVAAGTYPVLVTFTSADPNYANATLLTKFTVNKASPKFSGLSSPTVAVGEATTVVSGSVGAGTAVPGGEYVIVTLAGSSEVATVDANGNFSAAFATGALPVGSYTITYAYAGDANFKAASNGHGTLKVIPTAPPQVTLNPADAITTAGDGVSFTAAATGSPVPSVQWQVSTDGGTTWGDVTGNASATTPTLTFTYVYASQNGYKYRAVFTNSVGSATTLVATLTVEGGG